jgi:DNA polymerase I-like protein with 3'-5' exonuclease and polymerase domains
MTLQELQQMVDPQEPDREKAFFDAVMQIPDGDIHSLMAALCFEVDPSQVTSQQRGWAKKLNYLYLYSSRKGG